MRRYFTYAMLLGLTAFLLVGQEALTNDTVVKLVKAGIGEDVIVGMVNSQPGKYSVSATDVLALKGAGVPDKVMTAMIKKNEGGGAAPKPAEANGSLPPESAPAQAAKATPADVPVPDEQGVFWARGGKELVRIEGKAVSNVRTGSRLANSMTMGIKRARINAQLKGARAELRVKEHQPVFYLYLPEDASIGDYLLVRMAQRLDVRQLEIGQATFWKQQSGIDHAKEVEFTHDRVKPRLYRVTPNRELETGEYGFFVAAGSELKKPTGRIYDFGIDP